ncbi:hypothetical protein GWI33_001363, partial [Rhynchophorus ferrugineus]
AHLAGPWMRRGPLFIETLQDLLKRIVKDGRMIIIDARTHRRHFRPFAGTLPKEQAQIFQSPLIDNPISINGTRIPPPLITRTGHKPKSDTGSRDDTAREKNVNRTTRTPKPNGKSSKIRSADATNDEKTWSNVEIFSMAVREARSGRRYSACCKH